MFAAAAAELQHILSTYPVFFRDDGSDSESDDSDSVDSAAADAAAAAAELQHTLRSCSGVFLDDRRDSESSNELSHKSVKDSYTLEQWEATERNWAYMLELIQM